MDKVSYALGMSIAHIMLQSGVKDLTFDDFIAGVKATLQGEQPAVPYEEAEIGEAMKKDGEAFLAENAAKPGVITLASGLQYKVIKAGTGRKPRRSDRVRCHYEGTFTNGMVFDSSYKRGEPAVFGVGQVIAGWTEALQLMSEGSQWELYIPYNLAYGEAGAHGAIPPYAALVFKVELLEVL